MSNEQEIIEVEAVPIDTSIERVSYTPAVIDAAGYLEAKRGWIAKMMEPYVGLNDAAIAQMDEREIKLCRTDVRKVIDEVESERKTIKKAYNEPLARFEAAVKELLEPANEAEKMLHNALNVIADAKKSYREDVLRQAYEDYAPLLVDVVPFERVLQINPKWLNASYGEKKAVSELEDAIGAIAHDWETLKAQSDTLPFFQEAEAEFFRKLSLADALACSARRAEEQARIDAMKAEQEAIIAERNAEPEIDYEPAPITCDEDLYAPPHEVYVEPQVGFDMRMPRVMVFDASDAECAEVKRFFKENRIGVGKNYLFGYSSSTEAHIELDKRLSMRGDVAK